MATTRQMYRSAMDWWTGLPWYWKVLGSIPLIFIGLIGVVSLFTKKPKTVPPPIPYLPPITDMKDIWQKERELEIEIKARQKVIAKLIDESEATNAEAVTRLHQLMQTNNMEELDRLQKEWDL